MAHTQPQTFLQLWHKLQKVVTKYHPRQGHRDFLKHLFVQSVRSPQQLRQRKNQQLAAFDQFLGQLGQLAQMRPQRLPSGWRFG